MRSLSRKQLCLDELIPASSLRTISGGQWVDDDRWSRCGISWTTRAQPTGLPHGMPLSSGPTTEPMPEPAADPTTWAQEAEAAREAAETMHHFSAGLMDLARFRQRQLDHWPIVEAEVAYDQALHNGCPLCHKDDRLTRKRSSPGGNRTRTLGMPSIFSLSCERCHLKIGSKRVDLH